MNTSYSRPDPLMDPIVVPTPNMMQFMHILENMAAKSRCIIEIGTQYGSGSTLAFSRGFQKNKGWPDLVWVSVDIDYQIRHWMRPCAPFWKFVSGDSGDPKTAEKVKSHMGGWYPDVIFIDSMHTPEHLRKEFAAFEPLASTKTIWVFHDVYEEYVTDMGLVDRKEAAIYEAIKEYEEANKHLGYIELGNAGTGMGALVPKVMK